MAGEGSPPKELAYPIRAVTESMSFLSYFGEGCDRTSWRVDFATPENGRMCISNGSFIFQRFFSGDMSVFGGVYILPTVWGSYSLKKGRRLQDYTCIHRDSSAIIFRRTLKTQGFVK